MSFANLPPEVLQMLLGQQEPQGGQFPFSPSYGIEPAPEAPQRSAWDSIAMGLAAGLPQMPAARGAGASFAQGLARGFAMPRAAQVRAREESAAATAEDRRKQVSEAARSLRAFQHELRLEAAKAAMKPKAADKVDALDQPVDPEVLRGMGAPSWVKTNRHVSMWRMGVDDNRIAGVQAAEAKKRADDEAAQAAEDDAYVDAVVNFRESPKVPMSGRSFERAQRLRTKIDAALRDKGYSRSELEQLWDEAERFGKAGGSQRFVALRLAANTLAKHIRSLEKFYKRWDARYRQEQSAARRNPLKLKDLVIFNQGLFAAANAGLLGGDAAAQAAGLAPFITVVQNELPLVLANGYAPVDRQYAEADKLMGNLAGPKANAARVSSLKEIVGKRIDAMSELREFRSSRTGKLNPYSLKLNPLQGWQEGLKESDDADSAAGGKRPPLSEFEGN